jgi:hypothetical protein
MSENEELCDDGYCDIDDENISEDESEAVADSEIQDKFQKFIKKISRPS